LAHFLVQSVLFGGKDRSIAVWYLQLLQTLPVVLSLFQRFLVASSCENVKSRMRVIDEDETELKRCKKYVVTKLMF
jgi:hypothetical protein